MRFNKLSVKDKTVFDKYMALGCHELSPYAFENIYIWKGLFDIEWLILKGSLCVFFRDKFGCFLYLSPLTEKINPGIVRGVFKILDKFNKNKEISRIENVEAKDKVFYEKLGFVCRVKSSDYVCERQSLENLKGNRFKSKRAGFNYFVKRYKFEYLPFSSKYKDECLKLYDAWKGERKSQNKDLIYQGMLEDSYTCLENVLGAYKDLGLVGRVVRILPEMSLVESNLEPLKSASLAGFTFGFKLNSDTFCVLYEVTNLAIKGLAQFIFREFCSELKGYRYINIMDDSGLENLKKVKLSYHPERLVPAYIVTR